MALRRGHRCLDALSGGPSTPTGPPIPSLPGRPAQIQSSIIGTHKFDKVLPRPAFPDLKEVLLDYAKLAEPILAYKPHETFRLRELIDSFFFSENTKQLVRTVASQHRQAVRNGSSIHAAVHEASLLASREALAIGGNPFFVLKPHPDEGGNHQLRRAASLLHSTARYILAYNRRTIEPDADFYDPVWCKLEERAKHPLIQRLLSVLPASLALAVARYCKARPLSQHLLPRLFSTCRLPGIYRDAIGLAPVVSPRRKDQSSVPAESGAAPGPVVVELTAEAEAEAEAPPSSPAPSDVRGPAALSSHAAPDPHHRLHVMRMPSPTSGGARHVVVFVLGHIYQLDILSPTCEPLEERLIVSALAAIQRDAEAKGQNQTPMGVLTAGPRALWAATRHALLSQPANADALGIIESAIVGVSLEAGPGLDLNKEEGDRGMESGAKMFLCGTLGNRWFDKSFTWVVGRDGLTAASYERAALDGDVVGRFVESIVTDSHSMPDRRFVTEVLPLPSPEDRPDLYPEDDDPSCPSVEDFHIKRDAERRRRRVAIGANPMRLVQRLIQGENLYDPSLPTAPWAPVVFDLSHSNLPVLPALRNTLRLTTSARGPHRRGRRRGRHTFPSSATISSRGAGLFHRRRRRSVQPVGSDQTPGSGGSVPSPPFCPSAPSSSSSPSPSLFPSRTKRRRRVRRLTRTRPTSPPSIPIAISPSSPMASSSIPTSPPLPSPPPPSSRRGPHHRRVFPTVTYIQILPNGKKKYLIRPLPVPPRSQFTSDATYVRSARRILRLLEGAARQGRRLRGMRLAHAHGGTAAEVRLDKKRDDDRLSEDSVSRKGWIVPVPSIKSALPYGRPPPPLSRRLVRGALAASATLRRPSRAAITSGLPSPTPSVSPSPSPPISDKSKGDAMTNEGDGRTAAGGRDGTGRGGKPVNEGGDGDQVRPKGGTVRGRTDQSLVSTHGPPALRSPSLPAVLPSREWRYRIPRVPGGSVLGALRLTKEWVAVRTGKLRVGARHFDCYGRRLIHVGAQWPVDFATTALAATAFKNLHSAVPAVSFTASGSRLRAGREADTPYQSHQSVLAMRLLTEARPGAVVSSAILESYTRAMNIFVMRRNMTARVGFSPMTYLEALYQQALIERDRKGTPLPDLFQHETWRKTREAQLRVLHVPADDHFHTGPFLYGGVGPRVHEMYSVGTWHDQQRMTWTVFSNSADASGLAKDMDRGAVALAQLISDSAPHSYWRNFTRGGHFRPEGYTLYDYPFPEEDRLGFWAYHNLPRRRIEHTATRIPLELLFNQSDNAQFRAAGLFEFGWDGIAREQEKFEKAGLKNNLEWRWNKFLKSWVPFSKLVAATEERGMPMSPEQREALQRLLYEAFLVDIKIKMCMTEVDRRVHPLYPELDNDDIQDLYDTLQIDILDYFGSAKHVAKLSRKLEGLFSEEEIAGLDTMAARSDVLWAGIFETITRLTGGEHPGEILGSYSVFGAGKPDSALEDDSHLHIGEQLRRGIKDREKQTLVDSEDAEAIAAAAREETTALVQQAVNDRRAVARAEIQAALGGPARSPEALQEIAKREHLAAGKADGKIEGGGGGKVEGGGEAEKALEKAFAGERQSSG